MDGGPVQTRTADLYRVKVAVGSHIIEFIEAFGRSGVPKTRVRALIAAISQSEVFTGHGRPLSWLEASRTGC